MPGEYKINQTLLRPPHIHFLVSINDKRSLSTQLYFKGHPLNKKDFLYNTVKNKKSIEIELKKTEKKKLLHGVFNFII